MVVKSLDVEKYHLRIWVNNEGLPGILVQLRDNNVPW